MIDKLTLLSGLAAISSFLIATISFGSIWVFYFEEPYLKYLNLPFPQVSSIHYVQGETLKTIVSKCSTSDKSLLYSSTHFLMNDDTHHIIELPAIPLVVMPGCQTGTIDFTKLPADLLPGTYHAYGTSTISGGYTLHAVPWHTAPFEVVAK